MPSFKYKAIDRNGNVYRSSIQGKTKMECIEILKRNKLTPINLKEEKVNKKYITDIQKQVDLKRTVNTMNYKRKQDFKEVANIEIELLRKKPTKRDVIVFLQNLLLLKEAKYNNINALKTIIRSTENTELRLIINDILESIQQGQYMYQPMEKYPKIFTSLVINLIKVGELSGSLTESIKQAIVYIEDEEKIKKKVRRIVVPNVAMFVIVNIMLILGTLIAIPKIQGVFAQVGTKQSLPAATLMFQAILTGLIHYWYIPTIVIVTSITAFIFYYNTPKGRFNVDRLKYELPIFGSLIYSLDFTKLMRSILLNLKSGLRIQEALEVSRNVSNNLIMISLIDRGINQIYKGESWIEPFKEAKLGSRMSTDMLEVGMETNLQDTIEKILQFLEMDIEEKLSKIMKVLPELTYGLVGAVILVFVLVVLVPLIQVYMGTFLFSAYLDK
ncbi:MAG: type II secretion system F family protein [Clostridium sp.]